MTRSTLRGSGLAPALAGVGLVILGRGSAELGGVREWHRVVLLPLVAAVQQPVAGATLTTIGEPVAAAAILLILVGLIRWRQRAVGAALLGSGALVFLFYASWGAAYGYPPLGPRLAAASAPAESREIVLRTEQAAAFVTRSAAALKGDGATDREVFLAAINRAIATGFDALPAEIEAAPVHARSFGPAKFSRVSWALSRLQLSGYYFPWTGEAQINGEMPPSLWARVAAHEKAHQRGLARENEATVVGLLACLATDEPSVRYSGGLGLFVILDRELARAAPEARRGIWRALPARAASDLQAEIAFWKRFEGPAATVSERVNDTYLRTQGVRTGVASYGETTQLLLQALATPGLPLRAALEGSPAR